MYVVTLPEEVRRFLSAMSVGITFGLQGLATTPLECIAQEGFVPRLVFWMLVPPCVVLLVVIVVAAAPKSVGGLIDEPFLLNGQEKGVMERAAGPLLRLMFLLCAHSEAQTTG